MGDGLAGGGGAAAVQAKLRGQLGGRPDAELPHVGGWGQGVGQVTIM